MDRIRPKTILTTTRTPDDTPVGSGDDPESLGVPDDAHRRQVEQGLGGPTRAQGEAGTQVVPAGLALGARPQVETRYPADVQLGRAYRDPAHFGSFVSPAPTGALKAPEDLGVHLGSALALPLAELATDGPNGGPHVELMVTSSKALKWRPALEFVVAALAEQVPGFTAADVLAEIEAQGLDPDKPLSIRGAHLTLSTFKVDSGVPEQPIGLDQGLRGAIQRAQLPEKGAASSTIQARLASAEADGRTALVVSMENFFGLEPLEARAMPKAWQNAHGVTPEAYVGKRGAPNLGYLDAEGRLAVDRAAVFVDVAAAGRRQQAAVLSDGIAAPMAYLDAARATGQDITAGKFMSGDEVHAGLAPMGVSHDKWHGELVPGANRDQILADAVGRLPLQVRGAAG